MDKVTERMIRRVLTAGKDMTLATVRGDGYPQATTVSYVNDGLKIYFGCGRGAQKAQNIKRNDKVSLTINLPYTKWEKIRGLSLGGRARLVTEEGEVARVHKLMLRKFPRISDYAADDASEIAIFRITPKVVSVLDYTKGFGFTELVKL